MYLKDLVDLSEIDSDRHWYFYKDNIKLDKWDYELIRNLEIIKINLNTYFNSPYEGAGINISIYLREPHSKIK